MVRKVETVLCSPGWPRAHYVARDDFDLLMFWSLPGIAGVYCYIWLIVSHYFFLAVSGFLVVAASFLGLVG